MKPVMSMLSDLLAHLNEVGGSDLHLKPGAVPHVRIDGQLTPAPFDPVSAADVEAMAESALDESRQEELAGSGQTGAGLSVAGLGRFRISVHRQRGSLAIAVRRVPP